MAESPPNVPAHESGEAILRVVLADDHAVVREGLKSLINAQPDMMVVGEVGDGDAAWRAAVNLKPDILVVDVSMPGIGGVEATVRVRRDCPSVKVLALTVHEERLYLTQLLRAGATGYVLKRAAAADLVRAVRIVGGGGTYIDPDVAGTLVEGYLDSGSATAEFPKDSLSEREREILICIAQGYSNKEIAASKSLSVKTIETYKARMAEKLGLHTRVQIVRYAVSQGWLSHPPKA